ncbi:MULTISPECIES: SAM-dependent methyltransferase [unclassified Saccharopolyspora]|uniref:SAM-dependent methyltransferase n=1 Tax=unclassified Saccharopolyspora TaxID=2646250 RepID=UPI001CD457C2|nr:MULTISPECIES: SAM-dependent methyltransferase [unclassified Saccharopolyspora]MCA1185995.1 SAM-dependent methyltransferase [Saccharopolyspora sp. 6T]MCA1192378.1 SAM-dependent methyltransferase [Saccharopolyspora sp. 6V]MCA1227964.1 SAM-dependent methyltransferase [Saccharopolyspora sp. 6M]MCA1282523.1 SAM-dependent methyltransferase [Saccharopolyspora sp. 7B]
MPVPVEPSGTIDTSRPSAARVYDCAIGGKDHFEVDRELTRRINDAVPEASSLAVANRRFLVRAVRFLAREAGIDQYLDCGSGLPTAENTHQVAQRIAPEAQVVYVDNDPTVAAHSRALLADQEGSHFLDADIHRPAEVLGSRIVRDELDLTRPLALLHVGTLHHYDEERGGRSAADLVGEYVEALPAGSFVAFSHFLDPEDADGEPARLVEEMLRAGLGTGFFRTRAEIGAMLAGLEPLAPGLVVADDWWPDGPRRTPLPPVARCLAAAVARKP